MPPETTVLGQASYILAEGKKLSNWSWLLVNVMAIVMIKVVVIVFVAVVFIKSIHHLGIQLVETN